MTSTETRGLDIAAVSAWLTSTVAGVEPPFTFELIAAGGSNLTYDVHSGDGTRMVLRRPPLGRRLATAHDMRRETTVLRALAGGDVPVPAVLGHCTDEVVTGAEFYVMEFVDGHILRTAADTRSFAPADAEAATRSLVATHAAIHRLDLATAGLEDLARHDGYLERQLRRWRDQVQRGGARELPLVGAIHDRLAASVPPPSAAPGLLHGDYRFDNCILDPDLQVVAVLDWELSTIGDPIADFAWSLRYWAEPDETFTWLRDPPTAVAGFPDRASVTSMYREASGFDLAHLEWYEVFSWWKQACIVDGVHSRRRRGAGGGAAQSSIDAIAARVGTLLEHAVDRADRLGI